MKVFLSGPITGDDDYKEHFAEVEQALKAQGHIVLNPAIYPPGLTINDYMSLGLKMLDIADAVCFLHGWGDSRGAKIEMDYATYSGKMIMFEGASY